ncbi:MAG: hypothetical protein KJ666_03230 [Bacteroidetes bacterium]|nr:hypothetical protein [Bacteroidota bacterium]MBU2586172.1 hypothetical protein [Bacteroidota bacterium]
MKTNLTFLSYLLIIGFQLFSCSSKISTAEETMISELLEYLQNKNFTISEVMDYPILAIKNCHEGKMVKINKETVVILNFESVKDAAKYALTYAGTEKSYKTYSVGKFVIRSENSFDVGKAMKEALATF